VGLTNSQQEVRDSQIRALLGERPPTRSAIRERAAQAVDRFLALTAAPQGAKVMPGRCA
jgi:hypothetical protein